MPPIDPPVDRDQYHYVLRCADGSLYSGYTVDLPRRLAAHQAGTASRCTRSRRPVELVAWWAHPSQRSALQAELAFKRLTRAAKLQRLAATFPPGEPLRSNFRVPAEIGLDTSEQGSPTIRNSRFMPVGSWV